MESKSEHELEKFVEEVYQDPDTIEIISSMHPLLEHIKSRFVLDGDGKIVINRAFLSFILLDPDCVKEFQLATARTVDAFISAVDKQDSALVTESGFFIDSKYGELFIANAPEKPAAYDIPDPALIGLEEDVEEDDPERLTYVMVHTHSLSPSGDPLLPSVILETDDKRYKGDLYIFLALRQMRKKVLEAGEPIGFVEYPLSIILQDNLERFTVDMLIIREGVELDLLNEQTYLQRLIDSTETMTHASSSEEVCGILSDLGFRSSYLEFPVNRFYHYYPFIDLDQLPRITQDLGLE